MKHVRIGIDVGGTFTDILLLDEESGALVAEKIPSTSHDPSQGIADGVALILRRAGISVGHVAYLAHGSTVATNAVLEHRGAKTGLITTAGFKDVLEIGRQARPHLYDLQVDKPDPLVPRDLRLEVRERVLADGRTFIPLEVGDVEEVLAVLKQAGCDAVAICYLHGYRNPEHEKLTQDIVCRAMPGVYLSVAHEVLPEFREFERLNTTVVNAYLGPLVSSYVRKLDQRLFRSRACRESGTFDERGR